MRQRLTIVVSLLLVLGASVCVAAGTIEQAYKLMAHGEYEQAIKVLDAILTKPAAEEGKAVEPDLGLVLHRLHVLLRRLSIDLFPEHETVEMAVGPAEGDLEDGVEFAEAPVARNRQEPPNGGRDVLYRCFNRK